MDENEDLFEVNLDQQCDLLSISLDTSYNDSSTDEELGLTDRLNNLAK